MSDDYNELRAALAAQPTTEQWYHCQPYQTVGPLQTIHGPVKKMRTDFVSAQREPVHRKIIVPMPCGDCGRGVSSSVMGYIAAANPETVAALLAEVDTLRAENERLRQDAERWRFFVRLASLGFDGAPSWNAVIRFPVFSSDDMTITALVDTARLQAAGRVSDE